MSMEQKKIAIGALILSAFLICTFLITRDFSGRPGSERKDILRIGKKGDKVADIQRELKDAGYYKGSIDGNYDLETAEAVKKLQKEKKLEVNGVMDEKTMAALEAKLKEQKDKESTTERQASRGDEGNRGDIYLLARAVHAEARGEPYTGKVAVAAVILNRVKDPKFPNTIEAVIYQPNAFTAVSDGQINLAPDEESLRAARDAMNGWDPTGGAIYYYNPAKTTSKWIWSRPVHIVIGKHRFAT